MTKYERARVLGALFSLPLAFIPSQSASPSRAPTRRRLNALLCGSLLPRAGTRALQISMNAPVMVELDEKMTDPLEARRQRLAPRDPARVAPALRERHRERFRT